MNIAEFKKQFRHICTDTWGDALEAWFEAAGRLHTRGQELPKEWQYEPPLRGSATVKESYWFAMFRAASNKQLIQIGKFLFRYLQMIKYYKQDYD